MRFITEVTELLGKSMEILQKSERVRYAKDIRTEHNLERIGRPLSIESDLGRDSWNALKLHVRDKHHMSSPSVVLSYTIYIYIYKEPDISTQNSCVVGM